ncbi:unnamed protein product [Rotaria socialis]|uniref:Uncharacterized protein n=1 Tax=Rotaria socialis TaxID=392032 RepID=A0A820YCF9_9BILA|nr:unnamed protein product [Rotaria socialis]
MIDRIVALRLSDDHDTPHQIGLFFSHGFTLHQFAHLQSLTLYDVQSNETIRRILLQCYHLVNKVSECSNLTVTSIAETKAYKYFDLCKEIIFRFIPMCILKIFRINNISITNSPSSINNNDFDVTPITKCLSESQSPFPSGSTLTPNVKGRTSNCEITLFNNDHSRSISYRN